MDDERLFSPLDLTLARRPRSTWRVEASYAITDFEGRPHLVVTSPAAAPSREYAPLAHHELPAEFARLATGEPDAVLHFAHEYGQLGYQASNDDVGFEHMAVLLGRQSAEEIRSHSPGRWGDPVPWIVAHARAVSLVGDLAAALDDRVRLKATLDRLTVRTSDEETLMTFSCPMPTSIQPAPGCLPLAETPRRSAQDVIATLLNANIGGVDRHIVRGDQPELTSSFSLHNLLGAVWWLLADSVTAGTVQTCRACGQFFVAQHGHERFCPRPMGEEGKSKCMMRFKQQRYRDRAKQGMREAPSVPSPSPETPRVARPKERRLPKTTEEPTRMASRTRPTQRRRR